MAVTPNAEKLVGWIWMITIWSDQGVHEIVECRLFGKRPVFEP